MHFNKLACIYTEKDTSEMRNTHEFPFYFDLKVATQVLTKESNTSQNITYKNQVPSHIVRIWSKQKIKAIHQTTDVQKKFGNEEQLQFGRERNSSTA